MTKKLALFYYRDLINLKMEEKLVSSVHFLYSPSAVECGTCIHVSTFLWMGRDVRAMGLTALTPTQKNVSSY